MKKMMTMIMRRSKIDDIRIIYKIYRSLDKSMNYKAHPIHFDF